MSLLYILSTYVLKTFFREFFVWLPFAYLGGHFPRVSLSEEKGRSERFADGVKSI